MIFDPYKTPNTPPGETARPHKPVLPFLVLACATPLVAHVIARVTINSESSVLLGGVKLASVVAGWIIAVWTIERSAMSFWAKYLICVLGWCSVVVVAFLAPVVVDAFAGVLLRDMRN